MDWWCLQKPNGDLSIEKFDTKINANKMLNFAQKVSPQFNDYKVVRVNSDGRIERGEDA